MKRNKPILRILLTLALVFAALACRTREESIWPTDQWAVSTPEAEGMNEKPLIRLSDSIDSGRLGYIDHLLVIRNGKMVFERHYDLDYNQLSRGKSNALGCGYATCTDHDSLNDYNYLHPLRHPYYDGRPVHTLQSVTKSVTSIIIGQLIGKGQIAGTDSKLLSFFGDYNLTKVSPGLHDATLKDLLTMRSGIEWHEMDRPMDSTNSTLRLERSPDWIQFTLDQPMDARPGEKWAYSSGGSHLMSGIIQEITGESVELVAAESLFGPLGITEYYWKKDPTGHSDTEGGLYLKPADLARIGYLYLRKGIWRDQVVVDSTWVKRSVMRHVEDTGFAGLGYGYQWWRVDRDGAEIWACLGFGGNLLFVLPEYDIVTVINAWNVFDNPHESSMPTLLATLLESAGNTGNR